MRVPVIIAAIAAGSVVWLALLLIAPVALPPIALTAYAFGSLVCHQIADRSFHLDGAQMAVCARCTGIYAGAAAALLGFTGIAWRRPRWLGRIAVPLPRRRLWLMSAALPVGVSVVLEQLGMWYPSNVTRAATGVVLGVGVALVAGAAATLHLRGADVETGRSRQGPGSGF